MKMLTPLSGCALSAWCSVLAEQPQWHCTFLNKHASARRTLIDEAPQKWGSICPLRSEYYNGTYLK